MSLITILEGTKLLSLLVTASATPAKFASLTELIKIVPYFKEIGFIVLRQAHSLKFGNRLHYLFSLGLCLEIHLHNFPTLLAIMILCLTDALSASVIHCSNFSNEILLVTDECNTVVYKDSDSGVDGELLDVLGQALSSSNVKEGYLI